MTELIIYDHPESKSIETQLGLLSPRFGDALGAIMQPERLIRSVMVAMDRNRELFKCDRQSIIMAAMSAACVGLEVDGVLGSAFLVPFKVKERGLCAQFMTGYRGYVQLADRGGWSVRGAVVREGERFEFDKALGVVKHAQRLGNDGKIVAAWARAVCVDRLAIVEVVGIDELLELKARAKSGGSGFSPWNDPKVGFPAMCEKTPKRRLGRSLPLGNLRQFAMAARIDEAVEEQGAPAWATPDGVTIGEPSRVEPLPERSTVQTTINVTTQRPFPMLSPQLADRCARLCEYMKTVQSVRELDTAWSKMPKTIAQVLQTSPETHDAILMQYENRRSVLIDIEEGGR